MRTVHHMLLATMLTAAPIAVHAQDTTARARDSVTTIGRVQLAKVLDHTFTLAIGEPARVFLAQGVTYRVEVDGAGIELLLRPIDMSKQQPLIEPFLGGTSAGGVTSYLVKPRADTEYEFITKGGDGMRPVTLHVQAQTINKKA